MDKLKLRQFIICEGAEIDNDNNTFSAFGVYEHFKSPSYPSTLNFKCIIGFYMLNVDEKYDIVVKITQNNKVLGGWRMNQIKIDKPYEVANFYLESDEFIIPNEGWVQFDIIVNKKRIDRQFVYAVREEE